MSGHLKIVRPVDLTRAAAGTLLSEGRWRSIGRGLRLSARELQIVRGIFGSLKEGAIARELNIAPATVHGHVRRLYRKLAAHDHAEVILCVFREYVAQFGPAGPTAPAEKKSLAD